MACSAMGQCPSSGSCGCATAYNDMLSAHAPLQHYPDLIKVEARRLGATAQVAGGVPAMCDGVTQGTPGMELSLYSRDVIAMATAVALSHDVFDSMLLLGVCDKIVPGLLIGALHFGHLPAVFVPAGPMTSGLSNTAKSKVREQAAQGLVGRAELLLYPNGAADVNTFQDAGGPLARLRDGDLVRLDADAGMLQALVDPQEWDQRSVATMPSELMQANGLGMGRELFAAMRRNVTTAEQGAYAWL